MKTKCYKVCASMILSAATLGSAQAAVFNVEIVPGATAPGCESTAIGCADPSDLAIELGDTVEWLNNSGGATTVTSGTAANGPDGVFDSGLFSSGNTFSHTFNTAGEFPYFSMVHPWISGSVTVAGEVLPPPKDGTVQINPSAGAPGCETTGDCYIPFDIEILVGGTVTWENNTTFATTATSGTPAIGPSGEFDSGLLFGGNSFSHTFHTIGSFPYFSMVHPWMNGVVTVVTPEPGTAMLLALTGGLVLARTRRDGS